MQNAIRLAWLLSVMAAGNFLFAAPENPAPEAKVVRLWRQLDYGKAVPEKAAGVVFLDRNGNGLRDKEDAGVPDVSVSDGFSVVKTDSKGEYRLMPSALAVFIWVTRPSGHDVVGTWYKPVAPAVDFGVRPAALSEDEYAFVQVTDTHISADPRALKGLSSFVDEVNAMQPLPRFVVNSGDLVDLDKQLKMSEKEGRAFFDSYAGRMNKLKVPYYNVAGDHTDSQYRLKSFPIGDPRRAKAMFWEYFGPNFFSFEYGRVHFMSLDMIYHTDKRTHGLIPEHRAWFEQDMANRGPGSVVVTASEKTLELAVDGLADLGKKYSIALQMIGDDHIVAYKKQPVPTRTGGSLSGTWWHGPCADLSPQGYMIYHVKGTVLDCFYKGMGERVALVGPAYGGAVTGAVTIRAHLVNPDPEDALSYSVDGASWKPMKEVARPFCRALYEGNWDSTSAPDGLIELKVKNTRNGETRTAVFVVHNRDDGAQAAAEALLTFSVGDVIAAMNPPKGQVEALMNGVIIGTIAPNRSKEYVFKVPAAQLKTVNTLTFRFAKVGDGMTITYPFLTVNGMTNEDPYCAATRAARLKHWAANLVKQSGCIVGDGIDEGGFALKQNVFYFLPPSPKRAGAEPN